MRKNEFLKFLNGLEETLKGIKSEIDDLNLSKESKCNDDEILEKSMNKFFEFSKGSKNKWQYTMRCIIKFDK